MTTVTLDEVKAEVETAREASTFSLSRTLQVLFLGVFAAVGWTLGKILYLTASARAAFKIGYWKGAGITPELRAKKLAEKRARRAPQKPQTSR